MNLANSGIINFGVILFIITLIYLAKVEMVKSYFTLMALQGILLFGLAYLELKEVDIVQLLFILLETLVFKNGIFLLSLALGGEMPMFVNAAILLDIFTSVLIMGIFFNKLKEYFQNTDISQLSQLKD